ncbi:hypothetical protein [Escherichia coli]|uniref:hypothetical protein n=1 Tax=Escherichia coli TaxID=562 RepID=UPI003013E4A1
MNVFEMEGFLRGKCLPGDMKVNETTAEYLVRKLRKAGELTAAHSTIEKAREVTNCPGGVDLQDHLKQLVAENAALKKFCKNAAFDADYEAELGMERGGFTDAFNNIKTPATDSTLREAEARGVEAFTAKLRRDMEGLDPEIFAYGEVKNALDMAITSSEMFARQLREGKAE